MHLLQNLFYLNKDPYRYVKLMLGCIFLICGVLFAIYLIYLALLPSLGQIESGVVAACLLSSIGLTLLYIQSEKGEEEQGEIMSAMISELRDIDLMKAIASHPWSGLLVSLIAGIALSQVKDLKGLGELYEKLKSR